MSEQSTATAELLKTPLYDLHSELGARMVPFAGYHMPVQYPAGLMQEHLHTRQAAGLFDVSHMGQLFISGDKAALALEQILPIDLADLAVGKQRYGMLLNEQGGVIDDLMVFRREDGFYVVVNGACKHGDLAHLQKHIGAQCTITPQFDRALLALQGPKAVDALARLNPAVASLVFMEGGWYPVAGIECFITRSGYTGEDGFEISVAAADAERLARLLLAQPEVKPIGLGARNSLRLESGLCLYGNDMDAHTTPSEAALTWAIPKVRRTGGARAGGFMGAEKVLAQIDGTEPIQKKRVALIAKERIPVREPSPIQSLEANPIGAVCSGLLSPCLDLPIAFAYVDAAFASMGSQVQALVRGNPVLMEVVKAPFVEQRYYRG